MRSSLTSASRFLSVISLALALIGLATGCDDDASCGPDNAPDTGLVATDGAATLTFGNLTAGLNNDCPAADAPSGVVSVSIAGQQTDGAGLFTICVGRPDLLGGGLDLGVDTPGVEVRIVDVTGTADNCQYDFNTTEDPTGTASADGLCGGGADPAGFALVVDGAVTLSRTCGATVDLVSFTLRGRVAVAADQ